MRSSSLPRRDRVKLVASGGIVFLALALVTAAATTDRATSVVVFDGSQNRFALSTAASFTPGWVPSESDWQSAQQGAANTLTLSSRDQPQEFKAGETKQFRIAVRNASPTLLGKIELSVANTGPSTTGAGDDVLFERLFITITDENGTRLVSNTRASELRGAPWSVALQPGSQALLDVSLEYVPLASSNSAELGGIQFQFKGESQ